jgi:hypothetical protein
MTKTSLAGRKIAYHCHNGRQVIAIVTTHDLDTDILTVHQAVYADTLQPVNYRLGGAAVHVNDTVLLNI